MEQCILDAIRIFGALIFLVDLTFKIGYLSKSKFIDTTIRNIFLMFIVSRPVFIGLYHIFQASMVIHKVVHFYFMDKRGRNENQIINEEIELMKRQPNPFEDLNQEERKEAR